MYEGIFRRLLLKVYYFLFVYYYLVVVGGKLQHLSIVSAIISLVL